MSSINFVSPKTQSINTPFLYKDLHLDLAENNISNKSDIRVDYDLSAITNSINNIFNTKKGQRPLYPDFGLSLEQYLFEPVSRQVAYKIGKEIEEGIKIENRVVATRINISILDSEDGYSVELALFVPSLSINTVIYASITAETGFEIM